MSESKQRQYHSPELKAKVGLEAIRGTKTINARVETALAKRIESNKGHKPAANHPWRNMSVGKPATDGQAVTQ